ncbi:MAG: crossover junction endodeoxyribonuclease RuvC, partial [Sulfurovum sp.]|nr:crossover junction endodeoxyribonuclease RuvC [Sulfurovum sp.]
MNILGIDPGSRNLGYCIVNWDGKNFSLVEAGLLKMKGKELQEQIVELVEGIDIILKAHKVDEVAIEDIFFA